MRRPTELTVTMKFLYKNRSFFHLMTFERTDFIHLRDGENVSSDEKATPKKLEPFVINEGDSCSGSQSETQNPSPPFWEMTKKTLCELCIWHRGFVKDKGNIPVPLRGRFASILLLFRIQCCFAS
ncbi:hypothetical protein K1719_025138 [Acacia pycnantha]|nr:hypothetical protein K1719_025138 [Acacia pycnantha]